MRYRYHNIEFLLQDSNESYYWMGFLLADGCFRSSNNNGILEQISIMLSINDKDHLDKFTEKLNIKTVLRNNTGCITDVKATAQLNSQQRVTEICNKFNISFRKTYNPPNFKIYDDRFTKDQILSLIIGFIDGDGSIVDNGNNGYALKIQVHKSWKDNLEYINTFIHNYFEVSLDTKIIITKRGEASMNIGKQQILGFMKHFIETHELPVLERKWNKINSMNPITTKKPRAYRRALTVNGIEFKSQLAAAKYFGYSARHMGRLAKNSNNITINIKYL